MFVLEKYNLKSDFIMLFLAFYFRDSLSALKESAKHKTREFLIPIFFKVNGDTVHSVKEGPLQFVWEYLDTYFLQPSESSTLYDYVGDEDENDDDDDDDNDDTDVEGMRNDPLEDEDED